VRSQLPDYHPDFGTPLEWEVHLYRKVSKYDTKTGRPLVFSHYIPKLAIRQKSPSFRTHDDSVYVFDWKKKVFYSERGMKWR
jgi:hypothetical protein